MSTECRSRRPTHLHGVRCVTGLYTPPKRGSRVDTSTTRAASNAVSIRERIGRTQVDPGSLIGWGYGRGSIRTRGRHFWPGKSIRWASSPVAGALTFASCGGRWEATLRGHRDSSRWHLWSIGGERGECPLLPSCRSVFAPTGFECSYCLKLKRLGTAEVDKSVYLSPKKLVTKNIELYHQKGIIFQTL